MNIIKISLFFIFSIQSNLWAAKFEGAWLGKGQVIRTDWVENCDSMLVYISHTDEFFTIKRMDYNCDTMKYSFSTIPLKIVNDELWSPTEKIGTINGNELQFQTYGDDGLMQEFNFKVQGEKLSLSEIWFFDGEKSFEIQADYNLN